MNILKYTPLLSTLVAGVLLATPSTAYCDRKVTVVRDRDGDGHYNKKTYRVPDRRYGDYRGNYYGGGVYGRRPYYGRGYGFPSYYGHSPYRSGYYYGGGPAVTIVYDRTPTYRGTLAYTASDDLAEDVQSALRRRGYYRGSIDGDIGPGTRSAIRNYQADRGLAVTGRIDTRLLRSLGIS